MFRMNTQQKQKAFTLIKSSCANYYEGNCLLMDDGEPHPCPQLITASLICRYFRDAVLPADKELHTEILGPEAVKTCEVCKKPFRAISNRAKYCARCAQKVRLKRQREYMQKPRVTI